MLSLQKSAATLIFFLLPVTVLFIWGHCELCNLKNMGNEKDLLLDILTHLVIIQCCILISAWSHACLGEAVVSAILPCPNGNNVYGVKSLRLYMCSAEHFSLKGSSLTKNLLTVLVLAWGLNMLWQVLHILFAFKCKSLGFLVHCHLQVLLALPCSLPFNLCSFYLRIIPTTHLTLFLHW